MIYPTYTLGQRNPRNSTLIYLIGLVKATGYALTSIVLSCISVFVYCVSILSAYYVSILDYMTTFVTKIFKQHAFSPRVPP